MQIRIVTDHWSYGNLVKVTKLTCGLNVASELTKTSNVELRASFLYQGRQKVLILPLFPQICTSKDKQIIIKKLTNKTGELGRPCNRKERQ